MFCENKSVIKTHLTSLLKYWVLIYYLRQSETSSNSVWFAKTANYSTNLEACDLVKRSKVMSKARIVRSIRMLGRWCSNVDIVTSRHRTRQSWTSNCLVSNFIATVTCQHCFDARLGCRFNYWQVKLWAVVLCTQQTHIRTSQRLDTTKVTHM